MSKRNDTNVWNVTNPRLRFVKRNPLNADPKQPILVDCSSRRTVLPSSSSSSAAAVKDSKPGASSTKVLPKPVNIDTQDDRNPWTIVKGSSSKNTMVDASDSQGTELQRPLTEEELERLREIRRQRRRREKDAKKLIKEERKRKELYAPKTSKIHVVDSVQQLLTNSKGSSAKPKKQCPKDTVSVRPTFMRSLSNESRSKDKSKISFLDEEYPALGGSSEDVPINDGKIKSCKSETESASEWETEPEDTEDDNEKLHLEVVDKYISDALRKYVVKPNQISPNSTTPKSILKRSDLTEVTVASGTKLVCKKSESEKSEKCDQAEASETQHKFAWSDLVKSGGAISDRKPAKSDGNVRTAKAASGQQKPTIVSKKVKRKDPILFDIFEALKPKGDKVQKKVPSESKTNAHSTVRNALDSAPVKVRRGKERETRKKKRPTTMRKIILADRLIRQELHKARLKLQQEAKMSSKEAKMSSKEAKMSSKEAKCSTGGEAGQPPLKTDDPIESKPEKENDICDEEKGRVCEFASDRNLPSPRNAISPAVSHDPGECPSYDQMLQAAKSKIHSRKFGKYCNHVLSKEMDKLVAELMNELVKLQDKKHAEDPEKAKAKRRYVLGLREASKFLKVNKAAALIFAGDIEPVEKSGGLNDLVGEMIESAVYVDDDGVLIRSVPIFFVMNRYKFGKICRRKVPISCAAVLNYQGANETFKAMTSLLPKLKDDYNKRLREELDKMRPPPQPEQAEQVQPAAVGASQEKESDGFKNSDTVAQSIADSMIEKLKM